MVFLERPISAILLLVALVVFVIPLLQNTVFAESQADKEDSTDTKPEEVQESNELIESSTISSDLLDVLITFIIIGTIFLLFRSRQFEGLQVAQPDPGAAFCPRIVLIVILVMSVFNLWVIYRRVQQNEETELRGWSIQELSVISTMGSTDKQYYATIIFLVVYIAFLQPIGFLLETPIFVLVFAWTAGYKQPVRLAVFSVVSAMLIFILFRNVMNVPLPYGSDPFRGIGIFFENLL